MQEDPVQILEIRAAGGERPVTITAALTANASRAIVTALSEQLDRRGREPTTSIEDALELRERTALVERFEPLATAGAHGIVCFSEPDLRACLLELTDYADRVDGEHYQPVELRERLQVIARITPVLWDASCTAAEVAAEATSRTVVGAAPPSPSAVSGARCPCARRTEWPEVGVRGCHRRQRASDKRR